MRVTMKYLEERYKDEGFAKIYEKTKKQMVIHALKTQISNNKQSSTVQFYVAVQDIFPKLFHFVPSEEEYKKISDNLSNYFGNKKYTGIFEEYYEQLPNVFRKIQQKDDPKETNELNSGDDLYPGITPDMPFRVTVESFGGTHYKRQVTDGITGRDVMSLLARSPNTGCENLQWHE